MGSPDDRVPKKYRHRLHSLKNAYRKAFKTEPEVERPLTEEAALKAIAVLEEALQRAGMSTPSQQSPGPDPRDRRS